MLIIDPNIAIQFAEVNAFAESIGKADQLKGILDYLADYGKRKGRETRCHLYHDFMEHSFGFCVETRPDNCGDWRHLINGALIFYKPDREWSTHT